MSGWASTGRPDYLAAGYSESGPAQRQVDHSYTIYSLNAEGQFTQQKDSTGIPWEIVYTGFPNDPTRADTLRQHWIERLDY